MEKPTHEYLLEIAYESGYSFQMWFTEFEVEDGSWKWVASSAHSRPIIMNVDKIVSVIQLETIEIKDIV